MGVVIRACTVALPVAHPSFPEDLFYASRSRQAFAIGCFNREMNFRRRTQRRFVMFTIGARSGLGDGRAEGSLGKD